MKQEWLVQWVHEQLIECDIKRQVWTEHQQKWVWAELPLPDPDDVQNTTQKWQKRVLTLNPQTTGSLGLCHAGKTTHNSQIWVLWPDPVHTQHTQIWVQWSRCYSQWRKPTANGRQLREERLTPLRFGSHTHLFHLCVSVRNERAATGAQCPPAGVASGPEQKQCRQTRLKHPRYSSPDRSTLPCRRGQALTGECVWDIEWGFPCADDERPLTGEKHELQHCQKWKNESSEILKGNDS